MHWRANRWNICLSALVWICKCWWRGTFSPKFKRNISSLKWGWWWQKSTMDAHLSDQSGGAGKEWEEQSVVAVPLTRIPYRRCLSHRGENSPPRDLDEKLPSVLWDTTPSQAVMDRKDAFFYFKLPESESIVLGRKLFLKEEKERITWISTAVS